MNTRITLSLVASASLLALVGCKSKCDGFNPYASYERIKRPGDEEEEKEKVEPGLFYLACFARAEDERDEIERAINEALKESGGGSVSQVSDGKTAENMLQFARGDGGPYTNDKPRVSTYEVRFRANDEFDTSKPLVVEWDGGSSKKSFEVNAKDSPVRLLDLGESIFKLSFKEEAKLRCKGPDLLAKGEDTYRFRRVLFKLRDKQDKRDIDLDVLEETATVETPPVILYEVSGFGGNVSELLCHLLLENRPLDDSNNPRFASFAMRQTHVWLNATIGGGVFKTRISAGWEQEATGPATSVNVKVPGIGDYSVGGDIESDEYSLTATYDEDRDKVVLDFKLMISSDKSVPDSVVFEFSIDGEDFSESVKTKTEKEE